MRYLDCVTVNVCSPIFIVPVRVIVGLTVTRKVTAPLPLNWFAPMICIQFDVLLTE